MPAYSRIAAPLLAATLAAAGAEAATYSSFWVLGDSLSDTGNLYAATDGAQPQSPPYFAGRFSNGPVWADHIAADFTAQSLGAGNLAFGSARALPNGDQIPDLPLQFGLLGASLPADPGARPIAAIWIGSNDLIFEGVPSSRAEEVGAAAATAAANAAMSLPLLGIADVALFNLPDLGAAPYFLADPAISAEATRGAEAYNATLAGLVPQIESAGVTVSTIDIAGLFADLRENPAAFGVADPFTPCLVAGQSLCDAETAALLAFFDPLHPTAQIHAAIAEAVRSQVAPIPAPPPALLLVAGLAGLAFAARRKPPVARPRP